MGDFRKVMCVLAALVLFAGLASAQQVTCNTTTVPTNARSEGHTELAGDIVLTCSNPTSVTGTVNFQIFLNSQITSRVVSNTLPALSEVLLLINEPSGATTASTTGTSASGTCGTGFSANQYCFAGTVNGNSVSFFGIPIAAQGTSGSAVYRFTNIRFNANAIGSGSQPGQAIASVSVSATAAFSVQNNNQVVAYIQPGLSTDTGLRSVTNSGNVGTGTVGSPVIQNQCNTLLTTINNTTSVVYLHFVENFGTAFKVRSSNVSITTTVSGVPTIPNYGVVPTNANVLPPTGATNNTESGFVLPGATLGLSTNPGFADYGTRLKAVFNNIPAGVTISVARSQGNGSSGATAELVPSETSILSGSFTTVASGTTVALTAVNGQAVAVWEVVSSSLTIDTLNFQVWATFTASPGTNSPAPGIATVNLSFAPTGIGSSTSALTGPIPRFQDTSTAKQFLNIAICRTVLLFPFVTNQAGFDTGLAIANTSTDPFGTTPQSGTCQLNAYGANAPTVAVTSASVASGTVYTALASTSMPGFQGYVIAICNFQYAHGFAFVSDLGARNLAMGYLALIIPDPATGSRTASSGTDTGSSEVLAQ